MKARRSAAFGTPAEAVGPAKQRRLREAGEMLLARDPSLRVVRFDVVAVTGWSVRSSAPRSEPHRRRRRFVTGPAPAVTHPRGLPP